jgi:IS30 family transposase
LVARADRGWLKREFPTDEDLRVSHETIYGCLFVQARGVLKKELIGHLRAARRMRYPKGGTMPSRLPGQIVDAVSIRERPAEIEDRAVPGHWEGDLLSGTNNSHMATLVERHSRFAMLIKVRGKDTASVVSALSKQVRQLPVQLRRSLTWDRGKEMADHKSFTMATDVQVYFCDPRSPWQRGSNEHQRTVASVLPQRNGPLGLLSGVLEQDRVTPESTPQKNLGL